MPEVQILVFDAIGVTRNLDIRAVVRLPSIPGSTTMVSRLCGEGPIVPTKRKYM